jgi:Peroxiredoxin
MTSTSPLRTSLTAPTEALRAELRAQFGSGLDVFEHEADGLAELDLGDRGAGVGDPAPGFTLPDARGAMVDLATLLADGPVVLIFYRGAWCPFCNLQLRAFQAALPAITAAGATLVAVSPQTPDASLSLTEKADLEFAVLSDHANTVARSHGLVLTMGDAPRAAQRQAGLELAEVNGEDSGELPAPAVYVIGQNGTIRYKSISPDYRWRVGPDEVLAALAPATPALELLGQFLDRFGAGDVPGILALLDPDVAWTVQGDERVPWIGTRRGHSAVTEFLALLDSQLTPTAFTVDELLGGQDTAVALGSFAFQVGRTGKAFASDFSMIVSARNGRIVSYRIIEDSFAISQAWQ